MDRISAAEQAAHTKANATAATAVGTGTVGASGIIEENYQLIMLCIALIGLMSQLFFSWHSKRLAEKRYKLLEKERQDMLAGDKPNESN